MYIPQFWGGVLVTVFAEVVALLVTAVFMSIKGKKK